MSTFLILSYDVDYIDFYGVSMLIGTFVNAIYLYDDKAVIALNYKDGTKTVNFNDMECALSQRASIPGSDLEILSPPQVRV